MQVKITNKIYVKDPTKSILQYCQKSLILANPDFYKKEKMGKWTGNIPRYIYLYEQVGNDVILPFGCLRDIWKYIRDVNATYSVHFNDLRSIDYHSNINLYSYQKKAAEEAIRAKNGILVMPCGSGKTQTALQTVAELGGRCLWLTHTKDLLNQSMQRAKSVFDLPATAYGTITAGKVYVGSVMTFATVQTLSKLDLSAYRDQWDVVIVDECMPGETLIDTPTGKKELKNLCIDDIITSYNGNTGRLENKRITHVFKSKAHDIVKVTLSNGEEIICTKDHPIYTRSGQWIDAERLVHDDYVLRLVWERSGNGYDAENIKAQSIGARLLLLLKRMFCKGRSQKGCVDGGAQEKSIRNNEKHKQSVSRSVCGEDENRQSHEEAGSSESCITQAERNRASSKDSMREWHGINNFTADSYDCACRNAECICRISDTDKDAEREWISDLLQSGHCVAGAYDSNRDRRRFTLCDRTPESGQEENRIFEWVRVESVTVQEQTSDGTFGGLCADGYVYNIEVEDNNNYFANGVLVHNCQHAAGSPTRVTQFYKALSQLSARYKIGLTATPKRADGLERSMFALLGGIIYEVSRAEVAHTTCPVKVEEMQTNYIPNYDMVLMGDGTINYAKLLDDLIHNEDRFKIVSEKINSLRGSVLVLASRVDYIARLSEAYNGRSICLSTLGNSKRAKAIRKESLRKLNDGELDAVFCTYQLAAEGLDVPNLRYVVFATPEKDPTRIQQASGRVGRKAKGKERGIVIDFVDNFGLYKSWQKKRESVYKKLGYAIYAKEEEK